MKIRLGEVGSAGQDVDGTVAEDAVDWGTGGDFTVVAPVRVALHAVRIPGALLIKGRLSTTIECRCRRCDAPFRCDVSEPDFVRAWELSPDGQQWRARLEDEGVEPIHKHLNDKALHHEKPALSEPDAVDLTDDIREAMILAFPRYPVCRSECKGLCGRCGKNLNTGPCACTSPDDNRWTALDGLSVQ